MKFLKKITKMPAHFRTLAWVLLVIGLGYFFVYKSNTYKETNLQEKEQEVAKKENEAPVYKGGYYRYGIQRIKLTNTPQRYVFDKSADWEAWYDDPQTGLPFIVQFSIDGEKLDCRNPGVNHPPLGEIWVSKYPGNKEQYVNFSYSFARN